MASLGAFPHAASSQETQSLGENSQAAVFYQKAPDTGAPKTPDDGDDGGNGNVGGDETPDKDDNPDDGQGQNRDNPQGNGRARSDFGRGREAARRAFAEERMRQMMAHNGIASRATQDAILEFLRNDEEGKRSIRDAGRNLWNGMRHNVPAERLQTLLSDYQKAMQTQREARQRAQTALDARVGYTLNPPLEAFLWLLGVLGDGQNIIGNPSSMPQRRGGWGTPFSTSPLVPLQNKERQIDGVVNAKSRDGEVPVWLEIRDAQGQLWRASPQGEPIALQILSRQIQATLVGGRVTVRVGTLQVGGVNGNISLPLLAIIPVAKAGTTTGGDNPPVN